MELGQAVTFSKSLVKNTNYFIAYDDITEEQKTLLEEYGYLTIRRWNERTHKEKQGIICGKRNIVIKNELQEVEHEHSSDWRLETVESYGETVYLVACHMRGFYRVLKEDLTLIK